jgi:hypothetical protein
MLCASTMQRARRTADEEAFLLYGQALVFMCLTPLCLTAAQAAAAAAAQVVVRKRPSSEVDLDDAPGREERFRLLRAAEDTRKHYERQEGLASDLFGPLAFEKEKLVLEQAKLALEKEKLAVDQLASDLFGPLAFEKEKLALEQAKLALEKEKLAVDQAKLAFKADEFAQELAQRKEQDEWELEKKDKTRRNDFYWSVVNAQNEKMP